MQEKPEPSDRMTVQIDPNLYKNYAANPNPKNSFPLPHVPDPLAPPPPTRRPAAAALSSGRRAPPLPRHGAAGGLDRGGRWQALAPSLPTGGKAADRGGGTLPSVGSSGGEATAARWCPSGGGALPSARSSGRGAGGGLASLRQRRRFGGDDIGGLAATVATSPLI
uniref:Uncharacterized protein n=1 Tax=Oryza rufipogon TaxID=4529 RepID=A0A0E0PW70_ORYRU